MAEVLKKQKKIRGGHRGHVKKLLTQVEELISNFEPSLQDQLSQRKILLREKLDTLKNLDNKILELIDDKDGDDAIVNEVTEASKITDGITWAMVRIDSTLKSLQVNFPPISTSSALTGSPHAGILSNGATTASNVEVHAKLPKLQMKKSSGRPTEWQAFIDCFDSAIHSNPKLGDIDKMNYLRSLLKVQPHQQLKGYH